LCDLILRILMSFDYRRRLFRLRRLRLRNHFNFCDGFGFGDGLSMRRFVSRCGGSFFVNMRSRFRPFFHGRTR
jgi:hypothetical protein